MPCLPSVMNSKKSPCRISFCFCWPGLLPLPASLLQLFSCVGRRFTSLLGWRMRNWGCANADRIHANPFSLRISANCESDPQAREWMAVRFAQYQQALHILVGFARIRSVCESMRIANRQPSFSGPTLDYGWTRDGRGIFQNRSVQYNFEEFLPLHLF